MKIALVSPYDFSFPGGVTEHTHALAQGLQQQGHQVHILAACSNYTEKTASNIKPVTRKVTTFSIAGTVARVGVSPGSYLRIKQLLHQEKYHVIHLQEPLTPSITWWVLLQAKRSLPAAITVGTFHAYHEQPNWFYHHGRPLFGKLFTRLDSLIAVSEAARRFAYQMFPGQYQIIPNGIDLNRFGKVRTTHSVTRNREITILFVGRLDKRKGFPILFQAFLKLKIYYPNLKLQVVGPFTAIDYRIYTQLARQDSVTDIDFVGYSTPEQLPTFYHNADIFCAPSTGFESFGIVLLEAMAAQLPIVASDIAGYRSVISHGQEGLLVSPGQPELLAQALEQLINNAQLRLKMGKLGRSKANHYNWDNIVHHTLQHYHKTMEQAGVSKPSSSLYLMAAAHDHDGRLL